MKMLSPTPPPPALPPDPHRPPGGNQDTIHESHPSHPADNMTMTHQPVIIVRAEEALIVIMVLVLWVAAIALFFNRWGKIRMLEPYQPKFIQQHRPSCPLVDAVQQQRSFSKFNVNGDLILTQPHLLRPRQNSVFVGSSMVTLPLNPPRKVKSAFDLKNLVLSDPALNNSVVRLNLARDELRRSSMLPAFEKSQILAESRHNSICSTSRHDRTCPNVLSVDGSERTFLPPPIKSGVLDFRRNSMLIINNLAEDVSPTPFLRNLSLGGSNVNLSPEFSAAPRRNSVIPPYVKHKPKPIITQKTSKSLDSDVTTRKPAPAVSELRRQFLQPVTQKCGSLSSEVLTTDFPKIIETRCSSPVAPPDTDQFIYDPEQQERCSSQVNLLVADDVYYPAATSTCSLTDLRSGVIVTSKETNGLSASFKVTDV